MIFNSLDFALFLPVVFVLYWFLCKKSLKRQNYLIFFSSYFFYGWWDWRFLLLIIFSSIIDYSIGIFLINQQNINKRKLLLSISILINLGFLGFFKYYNFFVENFLIAFSFMGNNIKPNTLNIILPVGISFYTFQTLSYSIDVYRGNLKPTKDFIAFSAFVSFFPQLVAGPIERATNLLPQFYKKRKFNYDSAVDGLRQILWGFFKKIVIADNCATWANAIFNNHSEYNGSTLVLGAVFFSFQIYGDFSGYSDIAIGISKLLGFDLKKNFSFPYFSRDIAEFWRRWHISLSTWFRDYLYIPLGGSKKGKWKNIRNVFVIFIVSGFWHGANWTFIIWGALNAIYFLPLLLLKKNRLNTNTVAEGNILPTLKEFFSMLLTFTLTTLAWVFFRAENIKHAINYLSKIFSRSLFEVPDFKINSRYLLTLFLIFIFLTIEWIGREHEYAIEKLGFNKPRHLRLISYAILIYIIVFLGGSQDNFIYFQF